MLLLEQLYENHSDATTANESHKKCIKAKYDKVVCPRTFLEGDLVLVYDQDKDELGVGVFGKGSYKLVDYEGNLLVRPKNGFYLTKYYA